MPTRQRAPKGGTRVGGRFYKGGRLLPKDVPIKKHDRIHTAGRLRDLDPAAASPEVPPNFGQFPVPHILTFTSLIGTAAKTYRSPDEALKHSRQNAEIMRNDCSLMECLEARQRGTALLNWHLEPEDPKSLDQVELCDKLTKIIKEIPYFTEYRRNLLEALWYGRYGVQHAYAFDKRTGTKRTVIRDWRPVHGDKLVFRYDDGTGLYDPNQVGIRAGMHNLGKDPIAGDRKLEPTDYGLAYFLEPWERNLLAIHRHMIEDAPFESAINAGSIFGVGIRSRIYWTWFQAQETLAMLMEFLERSGQGIWVYYYPSGNPVAEQEVRKVAEQQTTTNIIVMPRMTGDPSMDPFGIERVEVSPAGAESLKQIVHDFFGHRIKRYILGQTLSSESDATGLGSGVADLHLESFLQIIHYDSSNLEETITRELVVPLQLYNFPKSANIRILFKIDTESADTAERLEAVERAWNIGAKIKSTDVMDLIGFSAPTEDDEVLQNPAIAQAAAAGAMGVGAQFEPSTDAELMGTVVEHLAGAAGPEQYARDADNCGTGAGGFQPGNTCAGEEGGASKTPDRSLDTMSEAIALSSPSGSMSKRAREAAQQRLSEALFGKGGLAKPKAEQPDRVASLRRRAKQLRELAARGMKPRSFKKEADELDAQADAIESAANKQQYAKFKESDHPRGQPDNPGQFSEKEGTDGKGVDAPTQGRAETEASPTTTAKEAGPTNPGADRPAGKDAALAPARREGTRQRSADRAGRRLGRP